MLEVVILLMTYLIKYVVQIKQKILNIHVFNMIPGKNESNILTKDISCECTCRFDEKNVIQINGGTSVNVDVSIKNVVYLKKIILGILVHVVVKMENIMHDSVIMCDEIIDAEETKTIPKNITCKTKIFYFFTYLFINYHCIIYSC